VDILNDFLSQGASVHVRNRHGHTPLFVAAQAGSKANVGLLVKAGAHLHAEETLEARKAAKAGSDEARDLWRTAGVNM